MHSIIISAIFVASALAAPLASDVETSLISKRGPSTTRTAITIDKCDTCWAEFHGFSVECRQCTESGKVDEDTVGHREFQFNDYEKCYEVFAELEEGSTIFKDYGIRPTKNGGNIYEKCTDVEQSVRDVLTGLPIDLQENTSLTPEEQATKEAENDDMILDGRAAVYISGTCSVRGRKMKVEKRIDGAHFSWSKDVEGGFYCTGEEAIESMGSAEI